MSSDPTASAGFARPSGYSRPKQRRRAVLAQLIATATLVVSTVIAVTAVSIGIARADSLAPIEAYGTRSATVSPVVEALAGWAA